MTTEPRQMWAHCGRKDVHEPHSDVEVMDETWGGEVRLARCWGHNAREPVPVDEAQPGDWLFL